MLKELRWKPLFQVTQNTEVLRVQEIGTYCTIYRPEGVLYGEGQGVITSKEGEIATWTASGIGRFTGQGKIRFHGPLFYRTLSTGKLSFLNNLVGVYETQIDENQNFSYKVWEWK